MLAKILGLTISDPNDLKPQTPVVYLSQRGTIVASPTKRTDRPYRVAIQLNPESANFYAQYILTNGKANWLGPSPRFPNPLERLIYWLIS